MRTQTTKLYNWAITKAESKHSPFWISLLFFLEIALFLPLDAVLMFFCLQNRRKILLYVALATITSTVSGLMGYLLGHFLWDLARPYVIPYIVSTAAFAKISLHFQHYESWAIFIGALLPFPLKVLTLSAGVFKLGILPFISYFMSARFIRFSLIGGAMMLWGDPIKNLLDRHFHRIIMIVGAKVAAIFIFFWFLAK